MVLRNENSWTKHCFYRCGWIPVFLGTSRGRSKKGEKCQIVGPCLRSKNIPVMAGLTDSTILHYNVFENNGNALAYAHFSDDAAGARDDAKLPENSIIVMDNLPFHKHARVIEIMQIRGWEWRFLPPYSPFLNPIECLFSQWKNHVKRSELSQSLKTWRSLTLQLEK